MVSMLRYARNSCLVNNAFQIDINIILGQDFMAQITLQDFINALEIPVDIRFEDTMAVIEAHYEFTPSAFTNGVQLNAVGENSGSCICFWPITSA